MAPTGWAVYKEITIQDTNVDANLTDFDFFIEIEGDSDIGGRAHSTGQNIRFTVSPHGDANLLDYHRRYFNIAAGAATGRWKVRIPSTLASGGATVHIWYDNSAAADGENVGATYEANYKGVYPMDEASGTTCTDVSGTSANGTYSGNLATQGSGGPGGYYQIFDGSTDYATLANAALDIAQNYTMELFLNPDNTDRTEFAFGAYYGSFLLGKSNIASGRWYTYLKVAGTLNYFQPASPTPTSAWHQLALTYDGSNVRHYLNGTLGDTDADTGNITDYTKDKYIGAYWSGGAASHFDGGIFETKISDTAVKSTAWIKLSYHNFIEADHEQTWGTEAGGSVAYIPKIIMIN